MFTKEELTSIKARLQTKKTELEKQVHELEEEVPEFGSDVDHFDEEADEAREYSRNAGIAQELRERLGNIETALEKLAQDKYGICEGCGKELSKEMVEVDPESKYCRECKLKMRDNE